MADPKAPIHQRFKQPGQEAIDPGQPVLFIDDSKVISITAKKMAVDNGQEIYYQITVEQV